MSAEQEATSARQFASHLVELRKRAGRPSHSTLERLSNHKLHRSTVSEILNGRRKKLPQWPFVAEFVEACRRAAAETRLGSGQLGTIDEQLGTIDDWKDLWDDAKIGRLDTHFPTHAGAGTVPASPQAPGADAKSAEVAPEPSATDLLTPVSARKSVAVAADQPMPAPADSAESRPPPLHGPVPRGVNDFIGREGLLDRLHQSFAVDTRRGALAIQGLRGIGKTQLAIAYIRRYAAHYDLVWWISCETRPLAERDMANLESQLGLTHVQTSPGQPRFAAVFDALRLRETYKRWLLVFDNADVPDKVEDLIPPRQGHVLITSRNNQWEVSEELIELDVFTRRESVEFLRSRMRGLSEADAQRLADATGDLPLALEHAAVSRIPAGDYLTRLENSPVALFSANQPPGYPLPVAEIWQRTIDELHSEPDAMELLRRLAFFGSGPIPLGMLDTGRFLPGVSLQAMLRDTIRRSHAIRVLRRTGLLRLGSTRTLHVHRLTQSIVRDTLTADVAQRCRHDVHLLLSAADPGDPDDPDHWPLYDELHGHMITSDVVGCQDVAVRHLVVHIAAYLNAVGNPAAARTLGDEALGRWSAGSGTNATDRTAGLAMCRPKADALFSLGQYQESLELSHDTLDEMRADPDKWSEEIIILGRAVGAGLRIQGSFTAARKADDESSEKHVSVLGHDHPQTFIAMNSLAIDHALNGGYEKAIQLTDKTYHDCRAAYDRLDHPLVLYYRNAVARSKRLAGQYGGALDLAENVHRGYRAIVARKVVDENHPWILTHETDLAVTRRDAGLIDTAFEGFASQDRDVHQSCWLAFGVDHPHTLAAAVALGSLLRRIGTREEEAGDMIAETADRYRATLGADHPYTHACMMALAGIRRLLGAPEESVLQLKNAVAGLKRTVGQDHPYTLDAVTALVNALLDAEDAANALALGEEALAGFRRVLGLDHPHTLACAANVAAAFASLGRDDDAAALRADTLERYKRTLGGEHPNVQLFVAGRRFDPDFTPLPL
jgi:tetratricopeptide (TPR) repeat protein